MVQSRTPARRSCLHLPRPFLGASGPGVEGPMDLSQVFPVHVGVDLCGGDVGVPQKLLNRGQIRATLQEMSGKAVPEGVG